MQAWHQPLYPAEPAVYRKFLPIGLARSAQPGIQGTQPIDRCLCLPSAGSNVDPGNGSEMGSPARHGPLCYTPAGHTEQQPYLLQEHHRSCSLHVSGPNRSSGSTLLYSAFLSSGLRSICACYNVTWQKVKRQAEHSFSWPIRQVHGEPTKSDDKESAGIFHQYIRHMAQNRYSIGQNMRCICPAAQPESPPIRDQEQRLSTVARATSSPIYSLIQPCSIRKRLRLFLHPNSLSLCQARPAAFPHAHCKTNQIASPGSIPASRLLAATFFHGLPGAVQQRPESQYCTSQETADRPGQAIRSWHMPECSRAHYPAERVRPLLRIFYHQGQGRDHVAPFFSAEIARGWRATPQWVDGWRSRGVGVQPLSQVCSPVVLQIFTIDARICSCQKEPSSCMVHRSSQP
jgi:hypothetical protein